MLYPHVSSLPGSDSIISLWEWNNCLVSLTSSVLWLSYINWSQWMYWYVSPLIDRPEASNKEQQVTVVMEPKQTTPGEREMICVCPTWRFSFCFLSSTSFTSTFQQDQCSSFLKTPQRSCSLSCPFHRHHFSMISNKVTKWSYHLRLKWFLFFFSLFTLCQINHWTNCWWPVPHSDPCYLDII